MAKHLSPSPPTPLPSQRQTLRAHRRMPFNAFSWPVWGRTGRAHRYRLPLAHDAQRPPLPHLAQPPFKGSKPGAGAGAASWLAEICTYGLGQCGPKLASGGYTGRICRNSCLVHGFETVLDGGHLLGAQIPTCI